MNSLKRLLIIIALFIMAVGCATRPPAKNIILKEIAEFDLPAKPNKGHGMIYVVRPGVMGTLVRFNVYVDDKKDTSEMGWNRGSQFIYFNVKPGKHKILSVAENTATVELNVKAGETYFIQQNAQLGFFMSGNNIEIVDADTGKYFIKKSTPGKILHEFKENSRLPASVK